MRHLLRFRVYTNPKERRTSPYFWCTVWRYKHQAQARMRAIGLIFTEQEDPAGACASWDRVRYNDKREIEYIHPEMGEIILCLKYSGSSTIYHECAHAASRLVERTTTYKIADVETQEERLCLTIGWMGRQIVKRLVAYDKRVQRAKSTKHHLMLLLIYLRLREMAR